MNSNGEVVKRATANLTKEAERLKNEAELLGNELSKMRLFLKKAEEKQYEYDTLTLLVSDVGDLVCDIEDALDDYHLELEREASDKTTSKPKKGIANWWISKTKKGAEKDNIAVEEKEPKDKPVVEEKEIGPFKERIEPLKGRIKDLTPRLQLPDSGGSRTTEDLRAVPNFTKEEDVVGFEDEARTLLDELFDANETSRSVISIFAMGGSGKTTLAKKLYNNGRVKTEFEIRAKVIVSKSYKTRNLLLKIVKSFEINTDNVSKLEGPDKKDDEGLQSYIQQSLQAHRYLVVIDDVWDKKAWRILEKVLPDNKRGSRVVITTRYKEVAENSDVNITHVHPLRKLEPNESWQLFYKEVSLNLEDDKKLQLLEELGGQPLKNLGEAMLGTPNDGLLPEKVGEMMARRRGDLTPDQETCKQMVDKCDGLPLAIVELGRLLCTKRDKWSDTSNNMVEELKERSDDISCLFGLCFNDLSYQQKHAFLYLCRFQEDFAMDTERLIHLLVAEGLIEDTQSHTEEEMAKKYLRELVNKSLIQVKEIYEYKASGIRVNDVLRECALEKVPLCPRQAVYFGTKNSLWLQQCDKKIRSLFLLHPRENQLVHKCCKFKSLRVLDVEKTPNHAEEQKIQTEEKGELTHLRFLRLSSIDFPISPSVLNLRKLQTLYIEGILRQRISLPDGFKLQELRHLIGKFHCMPFPIDSLLSKLKTLKFIDGKSWSEISENEKLTDLRELGVFVTSESPRVFCLDSIRNLKSLRRLSISLDPPSEYCFGSLEPLSGCPHLVHLSLDGRLSELPIDIDEILPELKFLCLKNTELEEDPMPLLGKLPKLIILDLLPKVYMGNKLVWGGGSFPSLEILSFHGYVEAIEEWVVHETALPVIKYLKWPIEMRSRLEIPERLRSVRTVIVF